MKRVIIGQLEIILASALALALAARLSYHGGLSFVVAMAGYISLGLWSSLKSTSRAGLPLLICFAEITIINVTLLLVFRDPYSADFEAIAGVYLFLFAIIFVVLGYGLGDLTKVLRLRRPRTETRDFGRKMNFN